MEEKTIEEFDSLITLLTINIEESYVMGQKHNLEEIMDRQLVFLNMIHKLLIFLEK